MRTSAMPMTLACPDETDLLMVAMGEPAATAVIDHVDGCSICQARLQRLRSEVGLFRADRADGSPWPLIRLDRQRAGRRARSVRQAGATAIVGIRRRSARASVVVFRDRSPGRR